MHIQTHGYGPNDLVLIHGWAMHGGVFAPLLPYLQHDFHLHLVDLPGHGHSRESTVPLTLDACVDAIAAHVPDTAIWCGWSLGGLVALHAAASGVPMQALAMLCATPCFVHRDDWPHGMSPTVFADFAHGLHYDWQGTLDRFLALEAFGSDHAKEELRSLRDALLARGKPALSVLADGLDILQNTDLRPALPSLQTRSTWIAGRRDRLVNPQAMQAATEIATDARFINIAQAGHAPFLTHAAEVAHGIKQLLEAAP
ncbi:pimeloyl-[acyl-carrier protein] methyl ester esterase [Lysobacteraceae bacterium NML08-0793]|nr:pimeloyl-[acyl-carrier protein] methyl ester esterase [Xanthomonadaceae bacterium NML08-0793]